MIKKIFFICLASLLFYNSFAQKPLEIRDSMLVIGSVYSDSFSRNELLTIDSIAILDSVNLTEIRYVSMYNMAFRAQGRYYQYVRVYNAKLSTRARNLIKSSHRGDAIILAGIKFRDADNKETRFSHAITIYIK